MGTGARSLTAAALARLLEQLDSDAAHAAEEYERLRRGLIRFFDWRGAWPADECADETIDRLCRKLDEGTRIDDVRAYARGIARLVLLERQRGPSFAPLEDGPAFAIEPGTNHAEHLRACFDTCLEALPADSRSLVLAYYEDEQNGKIANRRRLAAAAGLSDNALRSRVQRIRDRLERAIRDCLASSGHDV